jgi:NAD(P)-dependent dehydrogenase (short-subunit alcohol dehydrogenase family)
MSNRSDQVKIVLTGGGSGIGRAVALALAAQGYSIGVLDILKERAEKVSEEIRKAGGHAMPLVGDVSRKADVERIFSEVLQEWGHVDVLINSAGISYRRDPMELTEEEWDRMLAINLKGTFLCCQTILSSMIKRQKGRIVNMASSLGVTGALLMAHYAASKGGVIALTKSLALGMARYGINVNAVAPGPVDTPLVTRTPDWTKEVTNKTPLGRIAVPEDIVGAILFLAVGPSDYITGQILHVNGGLLMP